MIDPKEFYGMPKKPNYTFAYVVLALGICTIVFHYTVLPHILAHYGL